MERKYSIALVKEQVINTILLVASLAGLVAYISSTISRITTSNISISLVFETLIILSLLFITIKRKQISTSIKAYTMIFLVLLFSVSDAYFFGFFTAARVYLVLVPVLSIIYFPLVRSLILFGVSILGFLGIGYLHHTGILSMPEQYDPSVYVLRMYPWFINAIHITTVGLIILYITERFFETFSRLIKNLEESNLNISIKERNYREIFNSTSESIVIHDAKDGRVVDVNQVMLNMYGIPSKEDIVNKYLRDISGEVEPEVERKRMELIRKARDEGPQIFEWKATRKNGEKFDIEVTLRRTEIGGAERVLAVVRDISKRKAIEKELEAYRNHLENLVHERTEDLEAANEELKSTNTELYQQREELQVTLQKLQSAQKQLVHAEKMASLGVMAAGVAHEINNPLNFIRGGAVSVENYIEENLKMHDEKLSKWIAMINEGIDRAAEIITSLNHYSRKNDVVCTECNVHTIIDNCLLILNNQIKERIKVVKNYTTDKPMVKCNEGQMHQAILNILSNAVHAIEDTGNIIIETRVLKNKFNIIIRDNGCGIGLEDLSRITDPFFTTKEPGKGTGLGLSITQNIIDDHHGVLEFESKKGKGTQATISLPVEA